MGLIDEPAVALAVMKEGPEAKSRIQGNMKT